MDKVYKELDEVKAAMEKLTGEYRIKTELSERLQKAHNEQLAKIKEAKLEIEKQAQELNAKAEEISLVKQMYEDLKSNLHEKELALRHLSSANDKFRANCGEKLQKLEGENRELVSAVDEANMRAKDQEQKIHVYKEEIEGLKVLLSASQKKCFEAEQKVQGSNELRHRDDLLMKLEEEHRKIEDHLRWKEEQFKHLEEAHKKLQDQFQESSSEWELEKSTLLDEICSLQTSLDSQTRILESLEFQLQMCNQALTREESRRKLLEIQMSESKTCYESIFAEYQEAKSKIESLTFSRDEEIAALRNSLGTKETLFKDMEFRRGHLEQENQELRQSLKEFQEARIHKAGTASSLAKLRNKLRGLEQVHKDCSTNLKAREAEWSSQMEKMTNDCICRLGCKDKQMEDLQMELDVCHSSVMQLKLTNEESSVMLMVLKSGFSDAQSRLSNSKVEAKLCDQEKEERIAFLMEQLEKKNSALVKAHAEIEQEHETAASLTRKVESLDLIEWQYFLMQKELERYKVMLEESSGCQLRLKGQASQTEIAQKEQLREVSDALDKANSELAEKTCERSEIKFELERWKSVAERLKACLDENEEARREMEASLLAKVETEQTLQQEKEKLLCVAEEKDKRIDDLQQQIVLLQQELTRRKTETTILARMETQKDFEQEKECFLLLLEEKDKSIDSLQQRINLLEQEFTRGLEDTVLARTEAERTFEQEKDRLLQVVEEKDQILEDLRQQTMSLEQDFTQSVKISVLSGLVDKQAEIDRLHEAWEKIAIADVVAKLEIQEKNSVIVKLEEEINNLQQKLELQEKYSSHLKQQAEQFEAALESKLLEMEKAVKLWNKLRTSDGLIEKLESEKRLLLEDVMKLSSEREDLLTHVGRVCDQMSEFSDKDAEQMGVLERIVRSFDKESGPVMDLKEVDELYRSSRENVKAPLCSLAKKVEESPNRRSPLKEHNY